MCTFAKYKMKLIARERKKLKRLKASENKMTTLRDEDG